MADLFGVLDGHQLPRVRLTTLSKILHRKRPALIPLYDGHIRRCYQELGEAPVPPVKGRSWADFAAAWLPVVQQDLGEQLPFWLSLTRLAPIAPITPLRALDIVGWGAGHPRRPQLG